MMPLITISSNPPVRKLVSCRNGRKVSTTLWLSYLQLYQHKPSQMPIVRRQQRRYCRSCSIMYVCLHFTILLPNILQAMCVYGLHGISVSGIILGANLVAFYCATPKFLWPRAKICQHTAEYVMGSTRSPTISSLNNSVSSYYYYLILVILLTYCNKVIVLK